VALYCLINLNLNFLSQSLPRCAGCPGCLAAVFGVDCYRCFPVYIGGSNCTKGLSTTANNRYDNRQCIFCFQL